MKMIWYNFVKEVLPLFPCTTRIEVFDCSHNEIECACYGEDYTVEDIIKEVNDYDDSEIHFAKRENVFYVSPCSEGCFGAIKVYREEIIDNSKFWETDEVIYYGADDCCKCFKADLEKLPVGTIFEVDNGGWEGTITEHDGTKYVKISSDKEIYASSCYVGIENVRLPNDNENNCK